MTDVDGTASIAARAGVILTPDLFSLLEPDDRDLLASDTVGSTLVPTSLVTEPGFVRRVTVLAHSAPLHALESREGWQSFTEDRYDLRTLALAAIDLVAAQQGLEDEATAEDVLNLLAHLAGQAAPDADPDEPQSVARFVLKELLNDRDGGTDFTVYYSDYRTGTHRIPLRFSLLEESTGRSGGPVLRASVHAINALLGGLDLDVEDAQSAMDAVLRNQINKGQWGRAEESATKAMLLSLALSDKVNRLLEDTRRDLRTVDWSREVPELLTAARDHLNERYETEDRLIEWMRERRNDAVDPDVQATCARIIELLLRCWRRHTALHGQILPALQTFLDAQSEQRFQPPAPLRQIPLLDGLLRPVLRLPAGPAEAIGTAFADGVAGPITPRLARLSDLYDLLLAPARTPADPEPEEPPLELADDPEDHDDELVRAQVHDVLDTALQPGQALRLSALLDSLVDQPAQVRRLVALAAVWSYAPERDSDDADLDSHETSEASTGHRSAGSSGGLTTSLRTRPARGMLPGLPPPTPTTSAEQEGEITDLLLPEHILVIDDGRPLRHADACGTDLLLLDLRSVTP